MPICCAPTRSWSATPATRRSGDPAVTVSLRGLANVVVTVEALASEMHSGMFGGAAPDALAALIQMLATLRDDAGNTTIAGLDNTRTLDRRGLPADQFRTDAGVLDGVELLGDGTVSDMIWARPARDRARHRLPAGGRLGRRDPAHGRGPAQPARAARHGPGRRAGRADRAPAARRAVGRAGRRSSGRPWVRRSARRPAARRTRRSPTAMREAYGGR